MILNTKYSSQTSFGVTFKSANQADYPIIYSEDEWHVAKKDSDLCALYDEQNNKTTSETGANFTQGEVNETLSKAIALTNTDIDNLKNSLTNVYHYKGSVETFNDLDRYAAKVGDVYNVRDTGMNYAFVDDTALKIYTANGDIITGKQFIDIINNNNASNPYSTKLNVNGKILNVNIIGGLVSHSSGVYAFITSNTASDGTYYSGNDYVNLSSYNSDKGYYTLADSSVAWYMMTNLSRWDALGSTIDWTPTWEE